MLVIEDNVAIFIDVPVAPLLQLTEPMQPVAVKVAVCPPQTVTELTAIARQLAGLV